MSGPPGVDADAIANFVGTLDGLSLDEALANAELDAKSYGWSRATACALGRQIRARYARSHRGPRVSLVEKAMARLRTEGVPGPCACGERAAKFVWEGAAFSPPLCPSCGTQLPMVPLTEATP